MAERHYWPEPNRVGTLTAAVLLAYALTRLIEAPHYTLEFQLPGLYLVISLNLSTITVLLSAGLTATGMDWLLRDHPSLGEKRTIEHWLLPTLTTFVIGAPLSSLPIGPLWWIGFAGSGVLLVLVFLAEYIAVDPNAPYYAVATAMLTALSFALFVILAVALRYAGTRLLLIVPALFLAAALVSLRTLHLRLSGRWEFAWAAGIGLICAQLAAGLHYWPLTPIQYGLILFGPLYALSDLAASLGEGTPLRRAAVGPTVILAISLGGALLVR